MKKTVQTLVILLISIGMVISIDTGIASGVERQTITVQSKQSSGRLAIPVNKATIPSLQALILSVTLLNSAEVKLAWNMLDCIQYRIDKKKGNAAYSQLTLSPSGNTSFVDIQVLPNTSYTYRVFTISKGKDIYSNEVTITTGDNNPYTETVTCPQTVQLKTTVPDSTNWTGYYSTDTIQLSYVYTEDYGATQRLKCRYDECSTSCREISIHRDVPIGSCKKTDQSFQEKTFKCKKGVF